VRYRWPAHHRACIIVALASFVVSAAATTSRKITCLARIQPSSNDRGGSVLSRETGQNYGRSVANLALSSDVRFERSSDPVRVGVPLGVSFRR
jgi:hypothetical protein